MKYIESPNFPKTKVTAAAVSSSAKSVCEALAGNKVAVIPIESNEILPKGICSHADLQILHTGGKQILSSTCSNAQNDMLTALGFKIEHTEKELGSAYPEDCLINALLIGKKAILNISSADKKLIDFLENNDYTIINVRQGYTKCSVLPICEDAIITSDSVIAKVAGDYGIEALKIREGGIYLEGYETGFIGGCGGMIEKELLGTSGDFKILKDGDSIKDFLRNRNIYAENLGGKKVADIGGIIPLCETDE